MLTEEQIQKIADIIVQDGQVNILALAEDTELKDLFEQCGNEYPGIEKLVSIFEHEDLKKPFGFNIDYSKKDLIVTFEGLLSDTNFVNQMQTQYRLA